MKRPAPVPLYRLPPIKRVALGLLSVLTTILLGGVILWAVGSGRWTLSQSLYESLIAVSTVGFGELPGQEDTPGARLTVTFIILAGLGAVALFQSTLTAVLLEGAAGQLWRNWRMRNRLEQLKGHVVVAGVGSTGRHAVEELVATRTPFVAVDRNLDALEKINQDVCDGQMLYVAGDATEDQVLQAAGVERASGLIAALTHDKDNLFVTLSARTLNPSARIVSKVVELEAAPKMLRAGANATVSPNTMGGRRMASELTRPELVQLLDELLRDKDRSIRLEEVAVPLHSPWVGRPLKDLNMQGELHLFVVAVRGGERGLRYTPGPEDLVQGGSTLVLLGHEADMAAARSRLSG